MLATLLLVLLKAYYYYYYYYYYYNYHFLVRLLSAQLASRSMASYTSHNNTNTNNFFTSLPTHCIHQSFHPLPSAFLLTLTYQKCSKSIVLFPYFCPPFRFGSQGG
jgi:hypothetical protein